ncbi:MAG: adenine phosphoribosyltransferase [Dysgonamonadaceae bacterium]|jgi:adenine phosphoribosyltransferase|nr:adenine phosphoribosyltransferase [Dysgonamonadaceae bacterium]
MNTEQLKTYIRNVPDFPIKGIQFKDVTTLFKDAGILCELADMLYAAYRDKGITKVVGIESRGFIMGPLLAARLGAGFVPVRKPGRLPAAVFEETYQKEYGADSIQVHRDAIEAGETVLLHDDLLATGGTMSAAVSLIRKFNPAKIYVNFLIELEDLKGREAFSPDIRIDSIIKYPV